MTPDDHLLQAAVSVLDLPMALVSPSKDRQWFGAFLGFGVHGAPPEGQFDASVELAFCVFDLQPRSAPPNRRSSWIHNQLTLLICTS